MFWSRKKVILILEEDDSKIGLIRNDFSKHAENIELHFANSFNDVMDYLFKKNNDMNYPKPDLIILNLPSYIQEDIDMIKKIKVEKHSSIIPLIIAGCELNDEVIIKLYEYGVNAVICNRNDHHSYDYVIEKMRQFWINTTELPHQQ